MTQENVVQMPGLLERLADGIKADVERQRQGLAREKEGREAWIDATVSIGEQVAQAREALTSDRDFGEWWETHQGFNLGKNDRSALVAMGSAPKTMRAVLTETNQTSIRLIHQKHAARFPSAGKPPRRKPETHKDTDRPAQDKVRPIVEAKLDAGLPINAKEIAAQAGVSNDSVERSAAQAVAVREALAEAAANPPVDPATLPLSAQQKLEIATRRLQRDADRALAARLARLDDDIHEKVMAATAERLAMLQERQREEIEARDNYRRLTNEFRPIFTLDQWEVLRRVTHPDNSASEALRAQAFGLINTMKLQLTGAK